MSFVMAFIVGGLLCALFQVVMMLMKLHPPEMLIFGFALGAVLLPSGVIAWLEAVGGAGMSVMVIDAGAATFAGLMQLFHGDLATIVTLLLVFAALIVIGVLAGMLRRAYTSGKQNQPTSENTETI